MDDVNYTWRDRVEGARASGLLALELFIVFSDPTKGRAAVLDHLKIHIEYQRELERNGILFAAGPLSDETGQEWTGKGMIILRASSIEEARKIADADPMHRDKVRSYRIVPWLMNEGSFTLQFSLAAQRVTLA